MKAVYKKVLSIILVVLFCLSLSSVSANFLNNDNSINSSDNKKILCTATLEDDFADDSVIVVINEDYSEINKEFDLSVFNNETFEDIIDLSAVDGDIVEKEYLNTANFKQILKLKLKIKGKAEVLNAIKELEKIDWIESAEPNSYISQPFAAEESSLKKIISDIETYSAIVNDPNSLNMEALNKMRVQAAWDLETGKKDIRVGIIDTGIYEHEDLKDNLVAGWDFVNNNIKTNDDKTGHGTFVAGIIGAVGNNGKGIAGVCWNISLVPLQVVDTGGFNEGAIARAIQYANNNNIPIINCSFGWYSRNIHSIEAAIHNYRGLVVCSAGNKNSDNDSNIHYPSSYDFDNVIAVANVDEYGNFETSSNYGAVSVDIAACGTNIYSTSVEGSGYATNSGTSLAAPFVSATAALMLSYRPDLDAATLKEIILSTGTYNSALKGKVATSRILNIYNALYAVCKLSPPAKALVGDVNGDGRADLVSIGNHDSAYHGYVYVQFANSSSGYGTAKRVSTRKVVNYNDDLWLEDVNGDGKDDLICRVGDAQWDRGYIYVALSNGSGFNFWSYNSGHGVVSPYDEILFGDVNGDGRQDIICRGAVNQYDYGYIYTALSNGSGFNFWSYKSSAKKTNHGDRLWIGDVNGDKKDDIICEGDFAQGDAGYIYTALSNGTGFSFWSSKSTGKKLKNVDDKVWVEDVNGDGRADLIVQTGLNAWDTGYIWVALSNGKSFNFWSWNSEKKVVSETDEVMTADINGDGKTDLVVRGGSGKWDTGVIWTALSKGEKFEFWTGQSAKALNPRDRIFIGDVNKDYKDDIIAIGGYGYSDEGKLWVALSNNKNFNFWTWNGGKIGA